MLDFSKINKRFLKVQLTDGTVLLIRMPTKKIFDSLLKLKDSMKTANDPEVDEESAAAALDMTYDLVAELMSNNIGNKQISSEYLAGLFDTEDIQIFYESYLDFVTGKIAADPN